MIGDTQSRQETPLRLMPLGFNGTAGSDQSLQSGSIFGQSVAYGDLTQLMSFGGAKIDPSTFAAIDLDPRFAVQEQNPVRMPLLHSGEITQIYLNFRLRLGNDEPGTRTMWVGFCNGSLTNPHLPESMSPDTIKAAHRMITGDDTGFQAGPGEYIQFTKLNLTPLFKKSRNGRGWWGLVFLFDQKPARSYDPGASFTAIDNGYQMQVFRVEAMARFKGTQ